jgi:hypothetical protein
MCNNQNVEVKTMKISLSFVRKMFDNQRGQVMPWVAIGFAGILGIGGLTIDVGRAYVARTQLQGFADATALASVEELYTAPSSTTGAVYSAKQYASNYPANIGTVNTVPMLVCAKSLLPSGQSCPSTVDQSTGAGANAVQVTQTATVPTYFMRLFGFPSLTVKEIATATQGLAQPWNVAIILDGTPSMATSDNSGTCNGVSSEQCALTGIQTMLQNINPCLPGYSNSTCTPTSGSAMRVSLFTFPNVSTKQIAYDYNCLGSPTPLPSPLPYSLPIAPTTTSAGYTPITYTDLDSGWAAVGAGTTGSSYTPTYQVTVPNAGAADANGFVTDYYSGTAKTHLNSSSILVGAIGNGSTSGCLKAPPSSDYPDKPSGSNGGVTYFASAIYAAQLALQAEKKAVPSVNGVATQNAIIFVSDGQANTPQTMFPGYSKTGSEASTASAGGIATASSVKTGPSAGAYPSIFDACQQAIMAAQLVKSLGTRYYAVSFGSESGGCNVDTTVVANSEVATLPTPYNVLNQGSISSVNSVVPCLVMEDMASLGDAITPWYFYIDGSESVCSDPTGSRVPTSDLNSLFGAIGASLTNPKLISNSAVTSY